MKKNTPYQLILESLEERVFFDANPAAAIVEPTDGGVEDVTPDGAQMQAESEEVAAVQEETSTETAAQDVADVQQVEQVEDGLLEEQTADDSISTDQNDPLGSEPQEPVGTSLDNEQASEESDQDGNATETTAQDQNVLVEQEVVDKSGVDRVVFVDDNIKDFENLFNGVATDVSQLDESFNVDVLLKTSSLVVGDTEIVVLDHNSDELSQITESLAEYDELNSVHIFSYGSQNSLALGDTILTTANLDSYSTQISGWGEALSENGDFLLYGCNIAQDVTEDNFIESFAQLTDADVAASDDQTGNQASGGDWDLEVTSGDVESAALQDATQQWDGVLDPIALSNFPVDHINPMLNSTFNFSVTFDNSDTNDVGYGPYIDVFVPATVEIDGGPKYLGQDVPHKVYTWDADGGTGGTGAWLDSDSNIITTHPLESKNINLAEPNLDRTVDYEIVDGDKWYVVELPFGSFTPDQPTAEVEFEAKTSATAQVGEAIMITSRAGFTYGASPTNDNGPLQETVKDELIITPQVIDLEKTNNAPEEQTATGPNYPVTYTLRVNVAAGETVNDVVVTDYLPENTVYRGDAIVTPINGAGSFTGTIDAPTAFDVLGATTDSRLLTINFGNVAGVVDDSSGTSEYLITYSVYFSEVEYDVDPNDNIDPLSLLPNAGGDRFVLSEAAVTGEYNGNPVSDGVDLIVDPPNPDVDEDFINLNGNDNDTDTDNRIQIASIVTYKNVTVVDDGNGANDINGNEPAAPEKMLEWTIEGNISDYYTADNIILNDVYGDGQTFDQNTVTIVVVENGAEIFNGAFDPTYLTNEDEADNDGDNGETDLQFRVSEFLDNNGIASLRGSLRTDDLTDAADGLDDINSLNDRKSPDATYFVLKYFTTIDQDYNEYHTDATHGDASVDIGDDITNRVTLNALIIDKDGDSGDQEDVSAAEVTIPSGSVAKSIYAINGQTSYDIANGVQAGDTVTYRLKMDLPSADFENLVVKDFLPLPVFIVSELDNGSDNTPDADDFLFIGSGSNQEGVFLNGDATGNAGRIAFGSEHNLNNGYLTGLSYEDAGGTRTDVDNFRLPTIDVDITNNSIEFNFGKYDATVDGGATIDILITLTISDEPRVDELWLTNQGEWSIDNTSLTPDAEVDIIPIQLRAPEVNITKGVVDTGADLNPDQSQGTYIGNTGLNKLQFNDDGTISITGDGIVTADQLENDKVDADLTGADGGDIITFALTVYNTGGDDAHKVSLLDELPTGFVTPANIGELNLNIYSGDGNLISVGGYTSSLTNSNGSLNIDFDSVVLAGDPDGITNGSDVFIVTYQLVVDNETEPDADVVTAGSIHTNTAQVDFFTVNGSVDNWTGTVGVPEDNAEVTIAEPTVVKTLVDTEISEDGGESDLVNDKSTLNERLEAVIGELVTYKVVLTLPEGMTQGAVLRDQLDPGLTFVELVSVTPSSTTDLSTSRGDFSFDVANFTHTITDGNWVNIDLGSITNDNNDNTVAATETVTFVYTAFVSNILDNQSGDPLNNSARLTFTGGDGASNISSAEDVTVIEPELEVIKTVDVNGDTSGDAGDPVVYTIVIKHHDDSETTAYDVDFSDQIPDEIIGTTFTVSDTVVGLGALVEGDFDLTGNLLTLVGTVDMLEGREITLTVSGKLADEISPEQTITNDAVVTWQSLDNGVTPPHANDGTEERTGIDGIGEANLNNYAASDNANIDIFAVGISKTLFNTGISEDGGPTDLVNDKLALNERLEATIGEEVTYEVILTIPEGELINAQLVDLLDTGLQFVQVDSISVSTGLTTDPITSSVSGTGATGDQQTITFDLGTVTHIGTVLNSPGETVTIRYTAIVLDDVANFEGQSKDNAAKLIWDAGSGPGTGSSVTVDAEDLTIIEPWIETVKTVNQTTGVEAGDTLTYTVRLTNGGHAAAYEVNFHDILAPGTTFDAIATATIGAANVFAGSNATPSGDASITFTNDTWDLLVGETLIVTYTVDVTSDAVVDGTHTNKVDADWSNLQGADADERVYDEDDGIIDSPVDDDPYEDRDLDTAVFSMDAVTIAKSDNGVTTATIGDEITYTLTLNSPRGTVNSLVIEDLLPQGLIFNNNATISTEAPGSYTIETTTHTEIPTFGLNDGSAPVTITWDLGDTAIATDSPIIIEYTATVANVVSNSNETVLSNSASIEYDNALGNPQEPDSVYDELKIVEPVISTMKVIAGTADGATATVEVGDIVEYTVTLSNSDDADAFEVTAFDTLADGTSYFTDASHSPSATIGGVDAGITITDNGTTLSITNAADGWDLEVGESVVITYYAKVDASYMYNTNSNNTENTVDADWSNKDGVVDGERIYDDGDEHPLQTVDSDQDTDPADFDVLYTGSIGDLVFFDGDDSGDFSAGDVGISGVKVTLSADVDGDGTPDYTQIVTTDIDGKYLFENLAALSDYVITVDELTLPSEVHQTYDPDGPASLDGKHTQALTAGQNIDTVDFGYTGENDGSLGHYVWYDQNMNGEQDEVDLGIEGAKVTLHGDLDGDGDYEYTATAITDDDGFYQFSNLPLENYWVEVELSSLPIGLDSKTYERDGSLEVGTLDNRVDVADTEWDSLNPSIQDLDFGFAGTGSIGNYIWNNLDGDNVQDADESGLANVTVTLTGDFDNDGTLETLTTETGADGSYHFDNLPSGEFTIMVDESTLAESFVITSDPDTARDSISTVTLGVGETNNDQDFGYTETGSIGDTVFFDVNNNGIEDSGDVGISGVEVVLVGDVDLDGDLDTVTAITDSNGNYLFDGILPGKYSITVTPSTLPGGNNQTYDLDGLTSPDTSDVAIVAGEDKLDVDFGYTGTGSIGDTVWYDLDEDGVVDPGEEGIAGVKVTLEGDFDGDGVTDVVLETVTDVNGNYSFENLFAGEYSITSDPSTITDNYDPVYDADGTLDNTTTIQLGAGEVNNNVDFGYRPIPVLIQPPIPSPVTPSPEIVTPYDPLFRSYAEGGEDRDVDTFINMRRDESVFQEPLLPVSPIYTGHAEPGTTLYINLTDAQGNLVGSQLVMADTGGNWLANFSGTLLYDMPHNIEIQQDMSLYNASSDGGFNLRTYFMPALSTSPFTTYELTIDSIFATRPFAILEAMGEHYNQSGNLAWNDFYDYEIKAVSTNPSQSTL